MWGWPVEKYDVELTVLVHNGLKFMTHCCGFAGNRETLALSICDVVSPIVGTSTLCCSYSSSEHQMVLFASQSGLSATRNVVINTSFK